MEVVARFIRENQSLKLEVKNLKEELVEKEMAKEKEMEKKIEDGWKTIEIKQKKSFAEVMKTKQNVATLRKELMVEEKERSEKSGNVIVSGVESDGQEEAESKVKEMLEVLDVDMDGVKMEVVRLGKEEQEKRMLLVKVGEEKKRELLKKAKKLRETKFEKVFVQPDLTWAERKEQFELREERRKKKEKEPTKDWIIKMGKVVQRKTGK